VPRDTAFSLVEVVVAIGIVAFAILALVALLPIGLHAVRNSTEEIQAANLISVISSDLKDTSPTNETSAYFQLDPIPWKRDVAATVAGANPSIVVGQNYTFYFKDGQGLTSAGDARYRVTLRYTRVPGKASIVGDTPLAGGSSVIEALVMVSWPALVDPFPGASGGPTAQGHVEAYLTFSRP
jgi:uncharacterized protein (TIGR02598 family)